MHVCMQSVSKRHRSELRNRLVMTADAKDKGLPRPYTDRNLAVASLISTSVDL